MSSFTLDNQLCFALYSASNAVVRLYRPLLAPFDLTYPQFLVMLALWEEDGIQLKQLSKKTKLDPGTITPIVKRLEIKGLISRQSDLEDERAKRVVLTEHGKKMKAPLSEKHQCLFEQYADSVQELVKLRDMCNSLLNRINEHEYND